MVEIAATEVAAGSDRSAEIAVVDAVTHSPLDVEDAADGGVPLPAPVNGVLAAAETDDAANERPGRTDPAQDIGERGLPIKVELRALEVREAEAVDLRDD